MVIGAFILVQTTVLQAFDSLEKTPALGSATSGNLGNSEKSDNSAQADSSSQSAESAKGAEKPSLLGEPFAPGMLKLLQQEIVAGFAKRQITDNYARFRSYAGYKLNSSAGRYTGSELTGNCRLSWYDHMLRNPLSAITEAEQFTRELHQAVLDSHEGFAKVLAIAAKKMDLSEPKPRTFAKVTSAEEALDIVKQSLAEAQVCYAAALSPLTKSQIRELQSNIYSVLVGQSEVGHTLNDRGSGRRLCDLMEIMDRNALYAAADALAPLTDPELLEQLKSLPAEGNVKVEGITGVVVDCIQTPSGKIIIGGKGPNVYQLDKMPDVCAVIDLGGNDAYIDGTVGPERPVLVVIDLGGNDLYRGTKPGIQGGAILGVSMLLDLEGDDIYQAQDVAQGSAIAGVGILIDYAGNDRYIGLRRVQGAALGGLGVLIDRSGNDDYHAAMWRRGLAGRWVLVCSMIFPATIITIAAGCGAIPTTPRPRATRVGDKVWVKESVKWPTAASA